MDWEELLAARQVLTEERIGGPLREAYLRREREEEEKVAKTKDAIRRTQPGAPVQHAVAYTPAVIPPRPITDEIVGS